MSQQVVTTARTVRGSTSGLIPVFARREPTLDPYARQYGLTKKLDTVIYRDEQCTKVFVRYFWHRNDAPRMSTRRITLNCFNWGHCWLSSEASAVGGSA